VGAVGFGWVVLGGFLCGVGGGGGWSKNRGGLWWWGVVDGCGLCLGGVGFWVGGGGGVIWLNHRRFLKSTFYIGRFRVSDRAQIAATTQGRTTKQVFSRLGLDN